MGSDPNFRLKAFVVIAGVLGVFLVAFVTQRAFYWLRTRKRDDVETTRMEPVIDFSLLALGALVIWIAIEGLVLSLSLNQFNVQPASRTKIAEIEIGKFDKDSGQLTLLFYPANAAGQRQRDYRVPVFSSGGKFSIEVEVLEWRSGWTWLGERGFYQFVQLGGIDPETSQPRQGLRSLRTGERPGGLGALLYLRETQLWRAEPADEVVEGQIYNLYLGDKLEVTRREPERQP